MSIANEITRIQEAKSDIATAIENKGVTVPQSTKIDGMAALIDQIEDVKKDQAVENDVIFIDYDGIILYSYTAAQFALLEELPTLKTLEENMTALRWNWTLSDAKTYVATYGGLVIGEECATTDNKTHLRIELDEKYHEPYVGLAVNGTATINWGEGYEESTLTGSSITTYLFAKSPYTHGGYYHITISSSSNYRLGGDSNGAYLCCGQNGSSAINSVYNKAIHKVRLSSNASVANYAFIFCTNLKSVNITTFIGGYSFVRGTDLHGLVLPSETSSVNYNFMFYYSSCKFISFPKISGTSTGTYTFAYNTRLSRLYLPSTVTDYSTQSLCGLFSLKEIVIPAGVTSLGTYVFYNAYCLRKIKFLGSTPPTVSSTGSPFASVPTDCVISVPIGSLSAYTSAANYPSSSTYTYVEE